MSGNAYEFYEANDGSFGERVGPAPVDGRTFLQQANKDYESRVKKRLERVKRMACPIGFHRQVWVVGGKVKSLCVDENGDTETREDRQLRLEAQRYLENHETERWKNELKAVECRKGFERVVYQTEDGRWRGRCEKEKRKVETVSQKEQRMLQKTCDQGWTRVGDKKNGKFRTRCVKNPREVETKSQKMQRRMNKPCAAGWIRVKKEGQNGRTECKPFTASKIIALKQNRKKKRELKTQKIMRMIAVNPKLKAAYNAEMLERAAERRQKKQKAMAEFALRMQDPAAKEARDIQMAKKAANRVTARRLVVMRRCADKGLYFTEYKNKQKKSHFKCGAKIRADDPIFMNEAISYNKPAPIVSRFDDDDVMPAYTFNVPVVGAGTVVRTPLRRSTVVGAPPRRSSRLAR